MNRKSLEWYEIIHRYFKEKERYIELQCKLYLQLIWLMWTLYICLPICSKKSFFFQCMISCLEQCKVKRCLILVTYLNYFFSLKKIWFDNTRESVMMGYWFFFFTFLKAFRFRLYVNHSISVNYPFLVSVTLPNGSRSLLKSSMNIRNDILPAMHFKWQ